VGDRTLGTPKCRHAETTKILHTATLTSRAFTFYIILYIACFNESNLLLISVSKMPKSPSLETPSPEPLEAEEALALPNSPPRKRVRPAFETHEYHKEYLTPWKAMVQGTVSFLEAKDIPFFKEDVFRHFKVSYTRGYEMLKPKSSACRFDTLVEHNPLHRP
jgi:hypothetical protein